MESRGKLEKAVASYKQALMLDPNLPQAHLNLGLAYQRLGQTAKSSSEYQTACKLDQQFCKYVTPVSR